MFDLATRLIVIALICVMIAQLEVAIEKETDYHHRQCFNCHYHSSSIPITYRTPTPEEITRGSYLPDPPIPPDLMNPTKRK